MPVIVSVPRPSWWRSLVWLLPLVPLLGAGLACSLLWEKPAPDPGIQKLMLCFGAIAVAAAVVVLAGVLWVATADRRRRIVLDTERQTVRFEFFVAESGLFGLRRRVPVMEFPVREVRCPNDPTRSILAGPILLLDTPQGRIRLTGTMTHFATVGNYWSPVCVACDYDLTGNESGVCPECGNGEVRREAGVVEPPGGAGG